MKSEETRGQSKIWGIWKKFSLVVDALPQGEGVKDHSAGFFFPSRKSQSFKGFRKMSIE